MSFSTTDPEMPGACNSCGAPSLGMDSDQHDCFDVAAAAAVKVLIARLSPCGEGGLTAPQREALREVIAAAVRLVKTPEDDGEAQF